MRKRVLVIERDNDIRQLISYLLEEAGYLAINTAFDNHLVELIIQEKPDAIILDVFHPHIDSDLCKAIKSSKESSHIPLIVLSTHSKIDIMREICADEVIPKPFDIQTFISILEKQLVA